MTVLDKDGNAVESWTSTDKPHYMEKLPIGDYILREETAPEGYLIAEDVEFSVKDTGEIQKVSMKDEKKPSETPQTPQEPSKPTDTPKTGDDSNIRLWLLLAGLALCGTRGSLFLVKKEKIKRNIGCFRSAGLFWKHPVFLLMDERGVWR